MSPKPTAPDAGPCRLDWDDLRHFLAIARHGTLSGAARALGVRQSTMSRRLAALEARAGAQLLQKTPDGYRPSAAGEAILGPVERIEAEADTVARTITGTDLRLAGSVRITSVETLATLVLMPVLAGFARRYPDIELELLADSRDLDLSRREADVALRLAPYTQPGVVARRLARVGFGVYASADYLDRHGRPDFAAGAPGQYTVLPSDELRQAPEMQWFAARTHAARPGLHCNRRQAALAAIEAGMGIGCLARYLGDGRGLVRLDAGPPPPARALWYGVHEDIRHTARIRALAAALAEGFAAAAMRLDPPD